MVLEALASAGVHKRLIPDPDRVWSNFSTFQLYSPEVRLSSDFVQSLLAGPSPPPSTPLLASVRNTHPLALVPTPLLMTTADAGPTNSASINGPSFQPHWPLPAKVFT